MCNLSCTVAKIDYRSKKYYFSSTNSSSHRARHSNKKVIEYRHHYISKKLECVLNAAFNNS